MAYRSHQGVCPIICDPSQIAHHQFLYRCIFLQIIHQQWVTGKCETQGGPESIAFTTSLHTLKNYMHTLPCAPALQSCNIAPLVATCGWMLKHSHGIVWLRWLYWLGPHPCPHPSHHNHLSDNTCTHVRDGVAVLGILQAHPSEAATCAHGLNPAQITPPDLQCPYLP